jgi:energy-coupling factor transporter ATP-binding protein EcfA2
MVPTRSNEKAMGFLSDHSLGGDVRYAGITPQASEISSLSESLSRGLDILAYKDELRCLWVVLLGGTGTGKSSLFNAICGIALSATGVERPKTSGPIAHADAECPLEKGFPFSDLPIKRVLPPDLEGRPAAGNPGEFLVIENQKGTWPMVALVDTPDLDSVEAENRLVSERLYLLSDLVLFVTSQEKYADLVPHQFLQRVIREGKPLYCLVNKAQPALRWEDVVAVLPDDHPIRMTLKAWLIPYGSGGSHEAITLSEPFRQFLTTLKEKTSGEEAAQLRHQEISRLSAQLKKGVDRLVYLLEQEEKEAQTWLQKLDGLFEETTAGLIKREKEHFSSKSRDLLKEKVRGLFLRYDPLAKPRKFIREMVLLPFRLLGLGLADRQEDRNRELQRVAHKIDLSILRDCIHQFNRLALERLSPGLPDSPLFDKLREPGVFMADEEMAELIRSEQERLATWLEQTFERLAQELPRSKRWGIYSTSILWGLLIISFETVVGGGFTVLDAFLSSAIAPFLTKGATELFAYQEIRSVAHEMAKRYEAGLISTVRVQRDRYEACLDALRLSEERLDQLRVIRDRLARRVATEIRPTSGRGSE